jgi:hypothetical protein
MQLLFRNFSHPGGTGSHATPEVPGSLHEVRWARLEYTRGQGLIRELRTREESSGTPSLMLLERSSIDRI